MKVIIFFKSELSSNFVSSFNTLKYLKSSKYIAYLTSNDGTDDLVALGCVSEYEIPSKTDSLFQEMDDFISEHKNSYLFACLSYDLKNHMEDLKSENSDEINFPLLKIWKPKIVVSIKEDSFTCLQGEINFDYEQEIDSIIHSKKNNHNLPQINFVPRISKEEYSNCVKKIKKEISLGNIYELNFCQEFLSKNVPEFDSFSLFNKLNNLSKATFSAYLNLPNHEVFCASPERFIQKSGERLISQPIKGTIQRGKNKKEDEMLKNQLINDPKERAENIMIADLVRNDFSRIAEKNSVQVDELCRLYSFGTVHQLISTISCTIKKEIHFSQILKATFPMGSMTGAPKISAMEISEKYESFKRGLYSGSIGYFKPNGDFDFNVVIRSLILNKQSKVLSASVGGAITNQSIPEKEYEECLVKIQALLNLFKHD